MLTGRATRGWGRRYPPLAVVMVALALAVFALPSALNLPQANPGQTLEYAPVPGDQGQPSNNGNFAGLGLGQGGTGSGSVGNAGSGDQAGIPPPPQQALPGVGRTPSKYQCVGNPPRQTEDPNSPPCVAFFSGDNGGATHTGVTRDEITTLFTLDRSSYAASDGDEQGMAPGYYDLSQAPKGNEHVMLRGLRLWETYFNQRYQTYGRQVRFTAYVTPDSSPASPAARQADASDNFKTVHPFAGFPDLIYGNEQSYINATAQQGVMDFGALLMRTSDSFTTYPKQIWGFQPSTQEEARMYAAYVCAKAKPNPVSFSGNTPSDNGKTRHFGLIYTTDQNHPELVAYGQEVEQQLARCGISIGVDRGELPVWGDGLDSSGANTTAATAFLARFKRDGVTTVLWAGDPEITVSSTAAKTAYYPEWLLAGDGYQEGNFAGSLQDQQEWTNARVITPLVQDRAGQVSVDCREAALSINPSVSSVDLPYYCRWYDDLRQYFTGIQVSGPRLAPDTMDQGFRAIPAHASTTAGEPACFYVPGNYTCVKDAIAEWWDPHGGDPSAQSAGCWRINFDGRRYQPGNWPAGDVRAQEKPTNPCNTYFTKPV
jgi:hypothetical protein